MWLKVKPNDTLFFRTGRPFTMGDDTWTDSVFPPNPSTIYGAIRTFFIFEKGSLKEFKEGKFKDEIGALSEKGSLKIIGPFLYKESTNFIYFKPPLDLVELESKLIPLDLINKPDFFYSDDIPIDKILVFKGVKQVDEPDGWLHKITFKKYLKGKYDSMSTIKDKEIFEKELKIGIARDRKKFTSREGHLYRIPTIRLNKDFGLLIKIQELNDIPKRGVFQLGGEGKTVFYEILDSNPMEEIENLKLELKDNMFKIYLATPAIFRRGWIPEWIDENTLEGEKEGIKLKLISCVIGKFLRIGGWDLANNRPKPMYKAVPAGSVYYFKVLNDADFEKIKEAFHFRNISDINPEEGFGLSLVGVVG